MKSLPQVDAVQAAIGRLASQLDVVAEETVPVDAAEGRILSQALLADRDSPALDVSAMDGYAIHIASTKSATLRVQATSAAGKAPLELETGAAIRIFTGAPVPAGADCVVRREDTLEGDDEVTLQLPLDQLQPGKHIRRRGENSQGGGSVLEAGTLLNSAAMGAVASFASAHVSVFRRPRVAVLNTGDELVAAGQPAQPWQIRDSNGPLLTSWLGRLPWVQLAGRRPVIDRLQDVQQALDQALNDADAVILTGGVSMGDADYVPEAIQQIGGEIVFHRLPIRPGKPILGALRAGKLILGLPGNPVSVAVTARRFGLPLLTHLAGGTETAPEPLVQVPEADDKQIDLIWYRLVRLDSSGRARLVESRGSGDLVSLGASHGVIEVAAGQSARGQWPLFAW